MELRHEWKHRISPADRLVIRQRLGAVARRDPHAVDGIYQVRSLYFDTPGDKALREKLDGVDRREKFRIRYYNGDVSYITVEKKAKTRGLGSKVSCPITAAETAALLSGDIDWMLTGGRPLLQELYSKMRCQGLRPRIIVDYTREPFVYPPGNVRVTLDYDIRTALSSAGFLDPACITIPAADDPILMEVKWGAFLPTVIQDAVRLPGRQASAFSKYAACRIYG